MRDVTPWLDQLAIIEVRLRRAHMGHLSRRPTLASILAAGASAAVPSTRAAHADGTARVSFLVNATGSKKRTDAAAWRVSRL